MERAESAEGGEPDDRAESAERDGRVLRRARTAGLVVFALLAPALVVAVVLAGGDGRLGLAAVMLAFTFALLAASAWLLLAAGTDLLAGQRVSRRRAAWTTGVTLLAFLSPMFVLGAQGGG